MKILAVVSALDLRLTFGATSAWWQLFKGLYVDELHALRGSVPASDLAPEVVRRFDDAAIRDLQVALPPGLERTHPAVGTPASAVGRERAEVQ